MNTKIDSNQQHHIAVKQQFKNLKPGLQIPLGDLVIFTGSNNSGKSAILQYLNIHGGYGDKADYISPRRFDTSNEVREFEGGKRNQQKERKRLNESQSEIEGPDPIREIIALNDSEREQLISWHNKYFGEIKIESINPANSYSAPKITIDGRPATQQGSGSRAVLAILCKLFDQKVEYFLLTNLKSASNHKSNVNYLD